jgi:hypothetical protein
MDSATVAIQHEQQDRETDSAYEAIGMIRELQEWKCYRSHHRKRTTRYGQRHCGHPKHQEQQPRGTDSAYEAIGMMRRYEQRLQECHWHRNKERKRMHYRNEVPNEEEVQTSATKMRTWESAGF